MKKRAAVTPVGSTVLGSVTLGLLSWWVFVPTSLSEGAIAALVALAVAIGLNGLQKHLHPVARFRAAWLPLFLARIPGALARDTAQLAGAATLAGFTGRRHRGGCHRICCTAATDTPVARGRRAAILLVGSIAPNAIALAIDPGREVLVVHQAMPAPLARDPEWPL